MARQSLGSPQVTPSLPSRLFCTFLTTHFSLMAAGSNPVGTNMSVLSSTFLLLRNLRNNFNLATYHCISLTNQLFHLQHHITTQPLDVYSWPAKTGHCIGSFWHWRHSQGWRTSHAVVHTYPGLPPTTKKDPEVKQACQEMRKCSFDCNLWLSSAY